MCSWTRWALLPLWAAVWSYARRRCAGACPLSRGWRVSLFAPGARDQNAANLAGTTGGGCNLFCGEVHRLPLGLCRSPGGAAAIAWRWVRGCCDRCRGRVMLLPMSARRCCGGGWACTSGGGCRRPCGSWQVMRGLARRGWRNRAAPAPAWGRRRAGCDARRLRRRRRACWASLR